MADCKSLLAPRGKIIISLLSVCQKIQVIVEKSNKKTIEWLGRLIYEERLKELNMNGLAKQ